jgi:hypothetical protein
MEPVDVFLDQFMSPLLDQARFHRVEREYTLLSPEGNAVLVRVRSHDYGARVAFSVEWSAIPRVMLDFHGYGFGQEPPDWTWGVLHSQLVVLDPDCAVHTQPSLQGGPVMVPLILGIDEDDPAEMRRLAELAAAQRGDDALTVWLRDRLARRTG